MRSIKSLSGIVLSIFMSMPSITFAQFTDTMGEGFDKQSPEEIQSARQEIEALFGDTVRANLSPAEKKGNPRQISAS